LVRSTIRRRYYELHMQRIMDVFWHSDLTSPSSSDINNLVVSNGWALVERILEDKGP
jgi:hypothetical protein